MDSPHSRVLLVVDDRELTSLPISQLVGERRFGEIILRRRTLSEHFSEALPDWSLDKYHRLRTLDDLQTLRSEIEASDTNLSICIIAGRAGFSSQQGLAQLIERLPYAEETFTDSLYKPLIVFFSNAHDLIEHWDQLASEPVHMWKRHWQGAQRLESTRAEDLSHLDQFLAFTAGSTETRHFNEVDIDKYFYTKRSKDIKKMHAEFNFFELVPKSMQPWLVQPFDYMEGSSYASYRMMRHYLADAALQWIHGAFNDSGFEEFISRLLFFVTSRPQKATTHEDSEKACESIFLEKVRTRKEAFLSTDQGQQINSLAATSDPRLDIENQFERYLAVFEQHKGKLVSDHLVVGHGDPCLSNILYDQQHYLLKLIDPKGASEEAEIWTHPLYDLCKISHSILGDYDFINNGVYRIVLSPSNNLSINILGPAQKNLKELFIQKIRSSIFDEHLMRLGEASLFLSMLPLHMDHPNKVLAFMIQANKILDEVENEQ